MSLSQKNELLLASLEELKEEVNENIKSFQSQFNLKINLLISDFKDEIKEKEIPKEDENITTTDESQPVKLNRKARRAAAKKKDEEENDKSEKSNSVEEVEDAKEEVKEKNYLSVTKDGIKKDLQKTEVDKKDPENIDDIINSIIDDVDSKNVKKEADVESDETVEKYNSIKDEFVKSTISIDIYKQLSSDDELEIKTESFYVSRKLDQKFVSQLFFEIKDKGGLSVKKFIIDKFKLYFWILDNRLLIINKKFKDNQTTNSQLNDCVKFIKETLLFMHYNYKNDEGEYIQIPLWNIGLDNGIKNNNVYENKQYKIKSDSFIIKEIKKIEERKELKKYFSNAEMYKYSLLGEDYYYLKPGSKESCETIRKIITDNSQNNFLNRNAKNDPGIKLTNKYTVV